MNRERFLYWKFENLYSKEEVDILNKEIENLKSEGRDIPAEDIVKTAEIKVIDSSKIILLDKMTDSIIEANKNNFGYMFATDENSWHGLEKKAIKDERRCLQVNYVTFQTDYPVEK